MKTLITFCMALIAFGAVNGQQSPTHTLGMNFNYMSPTGGMREYIKNGFGGTATWLMEAPSHRMAGGLEFNITGYGHSSSSMEYTFADGTTAPMQLQVNNSFASLMGVTRLYLVLDGPVRPYATVKAGYTFFRTNLSIIDPDNGDSCQPVESDILSRDGTFAYSAGGGVRIDLAWIFKNKLQKGLYYIDVSSSMLQGGRVNYMNENAPAQNTTMHGSNRMQDVEAHFINTQTQVVHAHHVGYLYNSFLQMVDFRLGFSMAMWR